MKWLPANQAESLVALPAVEKSLLLVVRGEDLGNTSAVRCRTEEHVLIHG